jgi:RNA polymerase sigma-70 factor (ECF subfamily)
MLEKPGAGREEFERLYRDNRRWAFNIVYHHLRNINDTEDVVQDAFLRAWSRFDSFDPTASFRGWMYRILINTVIDRIRQRGRRPCLTIDSLFSAGERECDVVDVEATALNRIEIRRIQDDIQRLPRR